MTLNSSTAVVLLATLLCFVEGIRQKRGDFKFGLDPSVTNGKLSLASQLGYEDKESGFKTGVDYTKNFGGNDRYGAHIGYEKDGFSTGLNYGGTKGYDRFGGHIGYKNDNFHIKGTGFRDSTGNYGAGLSFGWSWKRSASVPKDLFFLRIEADPCQFMLYDSRIEEDGIITLEEVRDMFTITGFADNLFSALDIDKDGKVTKEEFSIAAPNTIAGCAAVADDDEK